MKQVALFCVGVVLFSVGIMLGAELNSMGKEKEVEQETKSLDSIQDVVLRNVQSGNKTEEEPLEVQPVTAMETKISPYATLTIEKYFKGCGHTTMDVIEIPKELVNMTQKELQEKYERWEILTFEERDIHIFREIDANCSSHFVVKEENGKVAVFSQISDHNMQFKENTDIDFFSLREEDQELIRKGIEIYGTEELSSFIEDFES